MSDLSCCDLLSLGDADEGLAATCDLPLGHEGFHMVTWEEDGKRILVTWWSL